MQLLSVEKVKIISLYPTHSAIWHHTYRKQSSILLYSLPPHQTADLLDHPIYNLMHVYVDFLHSKKDYGWCLCWDAFRLRTLNSSPACPIHEKVTISELDSRKLAKLPELDSGRWVDTPHLYAVQLVYQSAHLYVSPKPLVQITTDNSSTTPFYGWNMNSQSWFSSVQKEKAWEMLHNVILPPIWSRRMFCI